MLDEKFAEIVYVHNKVYQESTRHTPCQAKLPIDFNTDLSYDPDKKNNVKLDTPLEVLSMKHEEIQWSIKVACRTQLIPL